MRTFMRKLHLLRFHVWNFFWWYKDMRCGPKLTDEEAHAAIEKFNEIMENPHTDKLIWLGEPGEISTGCLLIEVHGMFNGTFAFRIDHHRNNLVQLEHVLQDTERTPKRR